MTLPNYFLADLPPQATLSEAIIREACDTLQRNRARYLADRSTQSIIATIADVAECWLDPDYRFRCLVLENGPAHTGFSREIIAEGLDMFFSGITSKSLQELVRQDLGHLQRLDAISTNDDEQRSGRASIARGPELLVHIAGGRIPNPTVSSIILGLLAHSAQFVKCATATAYIPRMFAHSLYEADPKLASCLEIAEWKGGNEAFERALFDAAACITATGSDETLGAIRRRIPARARFVSYGHRLSFSYVAYESLSGIHSPKVIANAAKDVTAWDQSGCLSPHLIYVEAGGRISPEDFAAMLAGELEQREKSHPRGSLDVHEHAAISTRRGFYEVRAAHSVDTKLWTSRDSTAWTVIYDSDTRFQISCLNRLVYVKSIADVEQALEGADDVRGKVSTVGLAAPEDKAERIANAFARWGVTRICPIGQMQSPPIAWRHDGRPALADLITWTDWET